MSSFRTPLCIGRALANVGILVIICHSMPFLLWRGTDGHSREVNPVPKGTSGVMTGNAGTIESSDKTVTLVAPSTRTRAKTLTKAPEQCKLLAVSVGGCILAR